MHPKPWPIDSLLVDLRICLDYSCIEWDMRYMVETKRMLITRLSSFGLNAAILQILNRGVWEVCMHPKPWSIES
jgi:hypothetical protein